MPDKRPPGDKNTHGSLFDKKGAVRADVADLVDPTDKHQETISAALKKLRGAAVEKGNISGDVIKKAKDSLPKHPSEGRGYHKGGVVIGARDGGAKGAPVGKRGR